MTRFASDKVLRHRRKNINAFDGVAHQIRFDEEIPAAQFLKRAAAEEELDSNHLVSSRWRPLPELFRTLAARDPRAVLLETAKEDSPNDISLLFLDPAEELVARTRDDLDELLLQVDRHTSKGRFAAGFFNYECGEHFIGLSPNADGRQRSLEPIAWLGVFVSVIEFDHRSGAIRGSLPPTPTAVDTTTPSPIITTEGLQISKLEYQARLKRVRDYLDAGHTYQVNFTDRICGSADSEPMEVYRTLLRQQPVSFAAYLNRPSGAILSFSPELFYRQLRGKITARPMKGTWTRGVNNAGDREAAFRLQNDEKNRSEHVMIVDLLRNDLGRLCEYGSIRVDNLFCVERYSTLLQMTSSISGVLRDASKPSQVFRTLFPCGSITGAPKRRTMEIIRELERFPRGIYTGAIGYFGPQGDACFNVAIRTLKLENEKITLGVGGGITADSETTSEYEECRLKGAFLTHRRPQFSLIETMRCDSGIPLLGRHMRRLAESADYFDIRYDAAALIDEIAGKAKQCGDVVSRIRVQLGQNGRWEISAAPLEDVPWNGRILLVPEKTSSKDIFLYHKTTNRTFYEHHFREARTGGFDEVLFLNQSLQVTEGAISNFFFRIDGQWRTPLLACGVLPGVLREIMLQTLQSAKECELELRDVASADRIVVCNALRGKRVVHSIQSAAQRILWTSGSLGHSVP